MIQTKRVHKKAYHGNCEEYERQLNEILQYLADEGIDADIHEVIDPAADFPFACTITWDEHFAIPECISDEYRLKGRKDSCHHCPLFKQEDKRKKTGLCEFFGKEVCRNDFACDHYWLAYVRSQEDAEDSD